MASNDRRAREERDRLRVYQARQSVHETKRKRRVRDNVVGVVIAVVVLTAATTAQVLYFNGGPGTPTASPTPTPGATPTTATGANSGEVPPQTLAENRTWTGTLTLNSIPLAIELDGAKAPQAVSSTISLAKSGFYNNLTCHRLTTTGIWVLQCGDPQGNGSGGPGYNYGPVENAPADNLYPAGTLAMARQGGDGYSNGSQFFIVYKDSPIPADTAGGYTVLGKITGGLDALMTGVIDAGGTSSDAPNVATTITEFTLR
ncbi:MAG: peptidylprolyl isomerase [Candidatus Lumbricidophila eiseniae]|uniref:Peptidylprolyl isomerase n=1 Tax=Candidatus Lumbricidiphila eiseniae TaxID=1969409 RepID=A0A2A6FTS2_9MICO|nr:MAG: peptidylprolyl isomerase [Candidatus Lumbricidophila eiseniae]